MVTGSLVLAGLLAGFNSASAAEPAAGRAALKVPLAEMAPLTGVAYAGDSLVTLGDYGVILTSTDGKNWAQANVPIDTPLTAASFVDAKEGWAVGHGGVVLHTSDGGKNWQLQSRIDGAPVLLALWFENAKHGITVGAYGSAFETKDGGQTWQKIKVGEGRDGDLHLNAIIADTSGNVFLAAESGAAFRSGDHGANWRKLKTGVNGSLWSGVFLKDGTVLLLGMSGRILASRDHGATWTIVTSGTQQALTSAAELPDGRVVIVGNGGVVTISPPGTLSFVASVREDRQNLAAVASVPGQRSLLLFGQQGLKQQP
jgi:photosystem II stability/assembly factor-like uncharacterized protein